MRRALLLIILLLIPSAWADEGESWTVEVEDPLGNPISGCDITLTEPWTGAVLSEPSGAMYQPSATCDGYAVMWHPPVASTQTTLVLDAYPLIEDLFTVQGAHTIQVLGSTWETSVSNGSVDAPNGIPVLVIGDGGSAVRTGQSSIVIPNQTTTYNLDGNFSEDVTISAFHTGSGKSVNWANNNLTVGEFGGGWTARVMVNGMPVGQSIWPPTVEWINQQINATSAVGNANLIFDSSLQPNENITGAWAASHVFNTGLGLSFIPGVQAGIASQVDRFLEGDTNNLENLLESMVYHNGREALCCIIDNDAVMFDDFSIESEIDLSSGVWGWNETGSITASRSQISMLRLEVPFQNDLRQITPLTITTDGDWQYLSSPLGEWIDGSTANFTLHRSESSVSGYYTITLGPNSAPVVSLEETYALPWDNTSYDFEAVISDAPLSLHDCQWNISGLTDSQGVDLSSFPVNSIIPVSVTCSDEGGLIGAWNDTFVLDGGSPWINATDDVQEIPPGLFDWNLMVGDDHDQNLRVYWTSNKSQDWWYTGDHLQTTFSVNSNLNTINDNISERHKQRNPVEYWLAVEVTDDVGHSTEGNWTIKLSDSNGPVVIPSIENFDDGEWIPTTSMMRPGDKIRLNLTQSFDDHSSIDKIDFSISLLGQEYNDLSWSEVQYWELPDLDVGMHQINVKGYDEAGNLAGATFGVAIAPPIARNLEIVEISPSSADIEPGENQFWVTVQNNGASTTDFILCSGDVCVESVVGPSSYSQTTTTIVAMNVDMDWFETFSVELSYLDDSNNTVTKQSISDYDSGAGIGGLELLLLVGVLVVAIVWLRSRNEPRF
jgi:hypothetical protein